MSVGSPQMAWAASMPEVTADSMLPASIPLRVQSPARKRF